MIKNFSSGFLPLLLLLARTSIRQLGIDTIPINATGSGLASGLAIPVTAGTRLLLVFSLSVPGGSAIALSGHVSGGVTIY